MKPELDTLTGLWNRDTVIDYLTQKINSKTAFSIALCDIDFFINIDSKIGSSEGDKILSRMAGFFSSHSEFITGRYCSDSFILIFENLDIVHTTSCVDEFRKQFRKQRFMDPQSIYAKVPITISFGVTHYFADGKSIEQIFKTAEIALAEAKKKAETVLPVPNIVKCRLSRMIVQGFLR